MGCIVSSSTNKGIINIDEEKLKKRDSSFSIYSFKK